MISGFIIGYPVRTIVRRAALPVLGLLVGLTVAAIVTGMIAPRYEATASVIIQSAAPTAADKGTVVDLSTAQNLAPTVARLASSREVALDIATTLGVSAESVLGHVTASSEPGIQIVVITTTAPTGQSAAAMADAAGAAVSRLSTRLRIGGDGTVSVTTLDHAGVPGQPTFPRPLLNYALGGLVGVLSGLGIITLRSRADDRYRRLAEVENELDLPAVGALRRPPARSIRPARRLYTRSDVSAGVNAMVAALSVLDAPGGRRRIVVTSAADDDAAAYVASLLAVGLRRSDVRTTVVEGQRRLRANGLRRPSALRGYLPGREDTVEDVLNRRRLRREAPADTPHAVFYDAVCGYAGSETPRGEQIGAIVDTLAAGGDYVVATAPSVLSGPGLSAIARHADVVLLVVSSDWVRKAEAVRAALLLRRLGTPLTGLVVLGTAAEESGSTTPNWTWTDAAAAGPVPAAVPRPVPTPVQPAELRPRGPRSGSSSHVGTTQGAP